MGNKAKEKQPVLAICYDFDKTLSPDDMQAQGYIQSVGYDVPSFWTESNKLASDNDMDNNLAYMYLMKEKAEGKTLFTRKNLEEYGSKVQLFPGVDSWFDRMRSYGQARGVIVEHYIISSGLKEMIEGTSVARARAFKRIYASSFYYNENGVAVWPAQVVNYTGKTQFLFRIEKGILDVNDNAVNDSFPPDKIRIPFRNMIYIGDSDTDIPCMKLVNTYGGHSIGVYDANTKDKAKVYKMMRDNRIRYFAPADYTEGSDLDKLVKIIIDRTSVNEALENIHYNCSNEQLGADNAASEDQREKLDLIMSLESSGSFKRTHDVIAKLKTFTDWSNSEKERMFKAALENSQIYSILKDTDISRFFNLLIETESTLSENAKKVLDILKNE